MQFQVWKKRDRVLIVTMPLRRVTEAAYERHRQKLAESASASPAAHSTSVPAVASSSAKSASDFATASPSAAPVATAAATMTTVVPTKSSTSAAAAQPQAPPTANPVAPTPTLFHFECLRCGFSSKQSSKTVLLRLLPITSIVRF
jgi:alpha-beta hydrolase superfamily lysophospholipase